MRVSSASVSLTQGNRSVITERGGSLAPSPFIPSWENPSLPARLLSNAVKRAKKTKTPASLAGV